MSPPMTAQRVVTAVTAVSAGTAMRAGGIQLCCRVQPRRQVLAGCSEVREEAVEGIEERVRRFSRLFDGFCHMFVHLSRNISLHHQGSEQANKNDAYELHGLT